MSACANWRNARPNRRAARRPLPLPKQDLRQHLRHPGPPARPSLRPARNRLPVRRRRPAPDTRDNLRRYQARIEEAQERKGKVEQRAAERKKPVRPLPVPP